MKSSKLVRISSIFLSAQVTSACVSSGETVGSTSSVVRTSIVPASVPYYLDLCGQAPDRTYALIAPAGLRDWEDAKGFPGDKAVEQQLRKKCTKARRIENGDPITVRLHRVGIGGLATFDNSGKCQQGCKRDVAVVLDFNGSASLQKPIVAFYQTDVAPDSNLQFINQIIFAQNEWFYRYPPSVRVRLYDVRDDKDAALRSNLKTIEKGASLISQYIAGAAIAGPIIDTAIGAADQLISTPRNRAIMDMSFQLFPDEQLEPEPAAKAKSEEEASEDLKDADTTDGAALTKPEVETLQKRLGMTGRAVDGTVGKITLANLKKKEPRLGNLTAGSTAFNRAIRTLLTGPALVGDLRPDATFGSPIYASQFIVFDEGARENVNCAAAGTPTDQARLGEELVRKGETAQRSAANGRQRLGRTLPSYYFAPDGVRYGGARVYAAAASGKCLLDASFVIFSITKESANVAADVAKRISDLQTKFSANQAVSEDAVAALASARVDAELALAIDRMENTRRADRLRAMTMKLISLTKEGSAVPTADHTVPPLPGAQYRNRAYRLIEDYLGCPLNEQTTVAELEELANALGATEWQTVRRQSLNKPYFEADRDRLKLTCPGSGGVVDAPADAKTPAPANASDPADQM